MKTICFSIIASICLAGCTSSSGLRPYRGVQKQWRTSEGAIADNIEGVLVYKTYPEKPYEIIGSIEVSGSQWQIGGITESQIQLEKRILKNAALEAKKYGGDAIFISNQSQYLDRIANVGNDVNNHAIPLYANKSAVTVIRFKNDQGLANGSIYGVWMCHRIENTGSDKMENPIFNFKADNTCDVSIEINGRRQTIKNGTFTINSNLIKIIYSDKTPEPLSYRINGDSLYITVDGETALFRRIQ
jgi:hypothetical protein